MRYVETFRNADSARTIRHQAWTPEHSKLQCLPVAAKIGELPEEVWRPGNEGRLVLCYGAPRDRSSHLMVEVPPDYSGRPLQTVAGAEAYDPLSSPEALNVFTRLDFSRDDQLVNFYARFGVVGFPSRHTELHQWRNSDGYDSAFPSEMEFGRGWGDRLELGGEPVWWLQERADELRFILKLYRSLAANDVRSLRGLLGKAQSGHEVAGFAVRLGDSGYQLWTGAGLRVGEVEEPLSQFGTFGYRLIHFPRSPSAQRPPRRAWRALTPLEARQSAQDIIADLVNLRLARVRRIAFPSAGAELTPLNPFVGQWACETLLEAMYVHILAIITGESRLRRCGACGSLFGVPRLETGRPKQYCDRRCRWKANKREQRKPDRQRARASQSRARDGSDVLRR